MTTNIKLKLTTHKMLIFERNENIHGKNLLQSYIYKILTYNNRRIEFECFIWGNDFFVQRCRLCKYIFIDGIFHIPKDFSQLLIFVYYDEQIEKKLASFLY